MSLNHEKLHDLMSDTLIKLKNGKIDVSTAREIFKGSNTIIQNCRNEIVMNQMGIGTSIPLMGMKALEASKKIKKAPVPATEEEISKIRRRIRM